MIPNRFHPSKSSAPNPRSNRAETFEPWSRRRRRSRARAMLYSALLVALLAALYVQTTVHWITLNATVDLMVGECEIYLNAERNAGRFTCKRHPQ